MTSDSPPTCRPCGQRGKVSLATWVRNDEAVQNWYLCDAHAGLITGYADLSTGALKQLPYAAEARRQNREAAEGASRD